SNLNQEHPFWLSLWEIVHSLLDQEAVKSLERQRDMLARRLERVRAPELAGIEDAAKRPSERHLENRLKEVNATLAKIENYSLKELLSELEKQISKTTLICRNFLPIGMVREERGVSAERDESRGVFGALEEI